MRRKLFAIAGVLGFAATVYGATTDIPFPEGYRNWYHHHSMVNLKGHAPEGNVGVQHVYANDLAVKGLRTGDFAKGAMFVVDRFKYAEGDNHTINQGGRKVVAVMLRDEERYADTGGWGFEAFKGGDPKQRVVKDQQACFACHIPHADNNYLFTRGMD